MANLQLEFDTFRICFVTDTKTDTYSELFFYLTDTGDLKCVHDDNLPMSIDTIHTVRSSGMREYKITGQHGLEYSVVYDHKNPQSFDVKIANTYSDMNVEINIVPDVYYSQATFFSFDKAFWLHCVKIPIEVSDNDKDVTPEIKYWLYKEDEELNKIK